VADKRLSRVPSLVADNPAMAIAPHIAAPAVTEREMDELQALLDRVPAPLEALDVSMLDGYLCGVLLQPQPVPMPRLLLFVTDVEGRALPAGFDATRLHSLVMKRRTELNDAIARRQWFDPWIFELDGEAQGHDAVDEDDEDSDHAPSGTDAVYPWVAGFATALDLFPALMQFDEQALTEPLALVYRHLAADDLEDADALLAEIETLEPPQDLAEAVEGLVRATLLLADISRPLQAVKAANRSAPRRRR